MTLRPLEIDAIMMSGVLGYFGLAFNACLQDVHVVRANGDTIYQLKLDE